MTDDSERMRRVNAISEQLRHELEQERHHGNVSVLPWLLVLSIAAIGAVIAIYIGWR
jgi:hypothetical protein